MTQIFFDYEECMLFEMMQEDAHLQSEIRKPQKRINKRFKSQQRYQDYFDATLKHLPFDDKGNGNYFEYEYEQ